MRERTEKVSTTLTPEEKQHVREMAALDGETMSELVRRLIYDEMRGRGREPNSLTERSE